MLGVLKGGMHASLPPNALLFHNPSVAWEKVLPVCLVNTTSHLQATSERKIGYQSQLRHLNARSGDMRACIPRAPARRLCTADTYKEDILKLTCNRSYESDNCYQDLIGHYDLLIHTLLLPYLVEDIEKLIQSIQQHLRPVTVTHHILMTEGAKLHAGGLERGDAHIPPS